MFEKLSSWASSLLPSSVNTKDKTGNPAIWFVLAVVCAAGAAVYFVAKAIAGKKKIFSLLLALSVVGIDYLIGGASVDVVAASLLFSVAASAAGAVNSLSFCPEFITFNIATVPSSFRIEVAGDGVIFSLDTNGMTNLSGVRQVGALPANQYVYQIADGVIKRNTTFTITNATAAQLDIYGFSNSKGSNYVAHLMTKAFANASSTVDNFLYAAFPSAAATDTFTITWSDRTVQTMRRLELVSYLAYRQQVADTRYNFDNFEREILDIQFIGAADQSVYYQRWMPAGGAVNQAL
jgi:hypothetical protein